MPTLFSGERVGFKFISFKSFLLKDLGCLLLNECVSPRVPLVEVLMITNQGYWLLMVKDELSDRLKLIKDQIKIIQAKDDNDVVDHALRGEVTQVKEPRRQVTKIPSSSIK